MASNNDQPQDLAAILNILSSFAPQATNPGLCNNDSTNSQGNNMGVIGVRSDPAVVYPSRCQPYDQNDERHTRESTDSSTIPTGLSMLHTSAPNLRQETPSQLRLATDVRKVIDWSTGLRHITQLAARDEALGRSVRRLIENQRQNERDWWNGRENLLQKQKDRAGNKERLNGVLRSIGGHVTNSDWLDPLTEMASYDLKVHRAQVMMVKAMDLELAGLGVPFFGTEDALIFDDKAATNALREQCDNVGRISRSQLLQLKRKMLRYLEDMYPG